MKHLPLLTLLFPLLLPAQVFQLDVSRTSVDLSGLSYYVSEVRNETGVTDGRYGEVYTGMLNSRRSVIFKVSMEHNLLVTLLRNTTERELTAGTLLVRYLRVDEDHSQEVQQRELRIEAVLEVAGQDGTTLQYGPRQVSRVARALDVSAGHSRALASALSELLRLLDADRQAGRQAPPAAPLARPTGYRPEGAYYSLADYRAGRVDTTLRLMLAEHRVARVSEQAIFYEVDFRRPDSLSRRALAPVWGYHRGGKDFLFVENRLLSLERDTAGQLFVAVPGGLQDPKASTVRELKNVALTSTFGLIGTLFTKSSDIHGEQELFLVDERSGGLQSQLAARETRGYLDSILLLNVSPPNATPLSVRFDGVTYRIPPGSYVAVAGGGALFIGPDDRPQEVTLRQSPDQPTVYTLTGRGGGRVKVERGSDANALATARSAAAGVLRRAR